MQKNCDETIQRYADREVACGRVGTGFLELFKHPQKDHIAVTTGDFQYYFFRDSAFQIDGINIADKFIFALDTHKIMHESVVEWSKAERL